MILERPDPPVETIKNFRDMPPMWLRNILSRVMGSSNTHMYIYDICIYKIYDLRGCMVKEACVTKGACMAKGGIHGWGMCGGSVHDRGVHGRGCAWQ